MSALLEISSLTMRFVGLIAVSNFNLALKKNELVGLIGPNGAGKTTVFNMLTGVYRPTEGQMRLNDKPLNDLKPHDITRLGMARTFQNIRLFKDLSVLDNVRLGHHIHFTYGFFSTALQTQHLHQEELETHKHSLELLKIFDLDKLDEWLASGGAK